MEIKPGYKLTEGGVIPEDWEVKQLKHISPSQSVGLVVNPSTYFDDAGAVPILVGSNIKGNFIIWESARRISDGSNHLLASSRLVAGDLVTVRVGEPGVTAVIPPELDGCNCASMMIVRQHFSFDSHWLCYVMNSRMGRSQVEHVQYGTAQKQFNISDAVNFSYPVPPLPEQRAIAAALNDAAALVESLEQLIAKKRDLKQGAMQVLLTGKERLPGYSVKWEVKLFGDLAQPRRERIDPRKTGVHDFCIELEHIEQESGRLAGSGATGEGSSLKSVFQSGDVLFGKLRAYLRKYWLADRSGVCSTEIWVLVPELSQVTPEFLFQLVTVDRFIQVASTAYGTHMPRSDWNVVKNYELALPCIDEQTAIAAFLSDMDAEIAALEAKLAKARQIKQGMMRNLLTGKIRLV
jgi:type I restriction enzyme S subunit